MLPLLLDAANRKMISLDKIIKLTSLNPAKIFSIKTRGQLAPGYYADLTVVDMDMVKEVENSRLFTKCGWSPFAGRKLKGWPVMTFVNGQLVFENGEMHHFLGEEVNYG